MSCEVTRRTVLQAVGTAGLVGFGGCNATPGNTVSAGDEQVIRAVEFQEAPFRASPGTWPMAHYDSGNTNYNPGPTWSEDALGDLTPRWRVEKEAKGAPRFRTPAVGGSGQVFSYDSAMGRLDAFDAQTGEERWTFETDADVTLTVYPTATESRVFFSSYGSSTGERVHALAAADGSDQWSVEGHFTPVPLVHGNVVFLCGSTVGAYDVSTGEAFWEVETPGNSLALASSTLYVVDTDTVADPPVTRLLAFDAVTGDRVWATALEGRRPLSMPVARDDTVFLVHANDLSAETEDPILTAFAADDGSQRWAFPGIACRPAVTPDTVYASDLSSTLYALDRTTGEVQWAHTHGGDTFEGTPLSSPVVVGDWVSLAYRMRIRRSWVDRTWVFDRTEQRPVYSLAGAMNVFDHPVVTEDTVYLASPNRLTAWHVG